MPPSTETLIQRVQQTQHGFADIKRAAVLSLLKDDESEYVRKSVGNALRDISRKHAELVKAEVATWDTSQKGIKQTYKLASKFL